MGVVGEVGGRWGHMSGGEGGLGVMGEAGCGVHVKWQRGWSVVGRVSVLAASEGAHQGAEVGGVV